jgi:hypothetical protein
VSQEKVVGTASYVSPEALPWKAMRRMLVDAVYGGRIDNSFDSSLLSYVHVHVQLPRLPSSP